ncbi:MAG: hypothetical protein ACUVTD_09420, partial [Nitrososphaerales archaeon]
IPMDDEDNLRLINISIDTRWAVLRKIANAQKGQEVDESGSRVLYRVKVCPIVRTLHLLDDKKVVDEEGREFKQFEIYIISENNINFQPGSIVRLQGKVCAHPYTQKVTLLAYSIENVEEFSIYDKEKISALISFFKDKSVEERKDWIIKNFLSYAKIVKRENLVFVSSLTFFSPLYIEFDGELIRGWIVSALIGDSTTGKSKTITAFIRLFQIGSYITAETASVVGLLGAAQKEKGENWVVSWGFVVLNDRKLLAIDGFHKLLKEQSTSLDESERTGTVTIAKAGAGSAYARTRLIKIMNPVERLGSFQTKPIKDFYYYALALPTVLNDTSIQRLDIAAFSSTDDVTAEEINKEFDDDIDPLFFNLKELLKYVWSGSYTIIFTEEAKKEILNKATELINTFSCSAARICSIDMKYKLARLSSALALLTASIDDDFIHVEVTKEHVDCIVKFLECEYRKANFHILAEKEKYEIINEEQARELLESIAQSVFKIQRSEENEKLFKEAVKTIYDIIQFIVEKGRVTKDQVLKHFHLADHNEGRPLFADLQNYELVERGQGFYPTRKAVDIVRVHGGLEYAF